ncbi:D-alanyl-D-alanine carboxypeptidase/D-alanyl-D-alanine-endopeptidase [bacterium]|nr:D-alanyl-D-alanine carboxypeptidase/D-alanyl-D-alanine-endopeptidase [bacterium]
MRRLSAAAAVAAVVLAATAARATEIDQRLATVLRQPGCRGAKVAALVVDAASGAELFAHDAETPLAPASNMKVLTAVAALAAFGPAHQFTTTVASDRPLDADGSVGVLALRGGGDPALTSEELWRLAADLQRRGLRRVRDGLLLDDSYFDGERWNPAWGAPSARAYHAPVSALTANYGAFSVEIAPPARAGLPARVSIDPPLPFFALSDAVRVGGDAPISVERDSDGGRERVRVGGSVRAGAAATTVQRSVTDPVRYTAALLRLQLAALGIAVEGPDRLGPLPPDYRELLAYRGQPLRDIAALLMKWSNNNIAEMLVKNLGARASGAPGSWASGIAAVRAQLAALGIEQNGLSMLDGSGLAAADRVTPRTLVSALRVARASFAFGAELAAALPIAGRDGTLAHRAGGALDRARAKTGMINGVASLSGYARAGDGRELVFSILNNESPAGDLAAVACNDAFVEALVQ